MPDAAATPGIDVDEVVERAVAVTGVPAPTGGEAERAALVSSWWRADGWSDVHSDAAGNVWATAHPGAGPGVVVAAHLDTVFPGGTPLEVRREGSRLIGPGIGDDGVALAALSAVARAAVPHLGALALYLLATVGEEGLGDLRGARHAVRSAPGPLAAFLAVEGNYLGRIVTTGVGSARWRIELSGPGGHAWERAGQPSAVHLAGGLVAELSRVPVVPGSTSLNVGTLHAGEAVNAIGREAVFDLDVRAVDPKDLEALEVAVLAVLSAELPGAVHLNASLAGRRPAGRIAPGHPLVRAAAEALERAGIPWREDATSTDANAAHEAGVPALALGITVGAGEHTTEEWIDTGPVGRGVLALADTIVRFGAATAAGDADRG